MLFSTIISRLAPTLDAVYILTPTYSEAEAIADVISNYRDEGSANVLVIDGGSIDGTRELAEDAGVHVVVQSGFEKGQAIRGAVGDHIQAPCVLVLDGDGTYEATDATKILDPLTEGYDHVIGSRSADIRPGAMARFNRVRNRIINRAFAFIHGQNLRDTLSDYRAFACESSLDMTLTFDGFGIETETVVECVKRGIKTTVVPMTYYPRPDGSGTNLDPIRDGGIIFLELYRRVKTNNPLFYFGSVGFASTATGLGLALYVAYEWVVRSISHKIIAIVSTAGILFGIQLLMPGVLSDLILSLHREQMKRIEELE